MKSKIGYSTTAFLPFRFLGGKELAVCTTKQKIEFAYAIPDGLTDSDYDKLENWFCQTGDLKRAKELAAMVVVLGASLQDILSSF